MLDERRRVDGRGRCRLLGPEHHPQREGAVRDRPPLGVRPRRRPRSPRRRRAVGDPRHAGPRGGARGRVRRGGRDRHPAGDPRGDRPARASRPAGTCWWRSRWRTPTTPACRWSAAAEERGVVLHCDHTFCYTHAVQAIRDLRRRRRAGRAPLLRLGPREPRAGPAGDRRLLGPGAPRPLDRGLHPRRRAGARDGHRAGRRPPRSRARVRGLPEPGLRRRPDRPLPSQLAQPDEDPDHHRRRVRAHGRVERPAPGAARERLRVRRGSGGERPHARGAAAAPGVLSDRQHGRAGAARARGAERACCATSRARSARGARR